MIDERDFTERAGATVGVVGQWDEKQMALIPSVTRPHICEAGKPWAPIRSTDDSIALAMELGIRVYPIRNRRAYAIWSSSNATAEAKVTMVEGERNHIASMRMAVVMVAAKLCHKIDV